MTTKDFENNEYKKQQCQMDSRFRGYDSESELSPLGTPFLSSSDLIGGSIGQSNHYYGFSGRTPDGVCRRMTVKSELSSSGLIGGATKQQFRIAESGRFPLSVTLGRSETKTRGSIKQQCRIAESGRSMVEMLGTLAIIGVLSIGGIAGYSYGMDKYRANATMNDINLRIVDLIAQANRGGDLSLSEWPTKSTARYDIGLEKDTTTSKNTGGIQVSGVPNRVCELLGEMTEVSNITLKITGTEYTKGSCGEENVMVFFQSDVVNGIGGTQPCNGPVVDGVCQPCEDGTWDETEEQCMCPNGCPLYRPLYSEYWGNCAHCPYNAVYSGCRCECPENHWYFDGSAMQSPECVPCPEGSTSPGGRVTECICETGTFKKCTHRTVGSCGELNCPSSDSQ